MVRRLPRGMRNVGRWAYRCKERALERLSKQHYYTARAYYHYQLGRADRRHNAPPVVVYQMGKVGSETICESLHRANLGRCIYHTHFLNPERIAAQEQQRKKLLRTPQERRLRLTWQYQYLRRWVERGLHDSRWKVITLVRDPVARNLSGFFQHIEVLPAGNNQKWRLKSEEYDFEIIIEDNNLDELIHLFFERFRHDIPLIFFDRELKGVLDVNVYASDFPTSQGYKIYQEKYIDVLLIRLENLNSCFQEALKRFLDVDDCVLVERNVSSSKKYAAIYEMFKMSINLPETYLDKLYASKFARHFYTEAEIAQFRAKWSRKSAVGETREVAKQTMF